MANATWKTSAFGNVAIAVASVFGSRKVKVLFRSKRDNFYNVNLLKLEPEVVASFKNSKAVMRAVKRAVKDEFKVYMGEGRKAMNLVLTSRTDKDANYGITLTEDSKGRPAVQVYSL